MRLPGSLRPLVIAVICLVAAISTSAQRDATALAGTVTDATGRVVPRVEIVARENSTGVERRTVSSSTGVYALTGLPVGVYTIALLRKDFAPLQFENVIQNLGQTRILNATLEVEGAKQEYQVTATPLSLEQTADTLGAGIERIQSQDLPLNGQNWATLTTLVPGAVDGAGGPGAGNQRSIRYAGRGRDDNNYTYDGVDATYVINQSELYYVRAAIPIDTISEIRVDPMLSTAQAGETAGAQLNLASASGSNQFHGDGYNFFRNNIFDATAPIDALNPTRRPRFGLNQFGGSFGGPIERNRTFFFVAYEGYRQALGQTLIGYVPSPGFAAQVLRMSPSLAAIINAYPQATNPTSDPRVDQFVGEGEQVGREDSAMFRIDRRLSEATSLFVRTNIDKADYVVPYSPSSGQYLDEQEKLGSSPANAVISLSHVFSPTLLNESKFGFNRGTMNTTYLNRFGSLDAISVAGLTSLNNGRVTTGAGNTFSEIDDLTWVKGGHVLKAGAELRRIQMNQGGSAYGTISFNSLASFAANQSYKATITGRYPVNGLRKTDYIGYLQDEFKWRPNLTVNLGLRYNVFGIFSEVEHRGNPFDFSTCGALGYCGQGASFGPGNYGDIDPRLALAWAPSSFNGRTVIRSGFGVYHEDGQLDDQNLPDKNEVLSYSLNPQNCPGLSYPIVVDAAGNPACSNGANSPNAEQRNRKDTSATEWGLSLEQALAGDVVGTLSYVASKGTHLLSESYVNVVNPLTGERPYNPPFNNQIAWRGTVGNSEYEALSVSLKRSFSRGLLVSANYAWSHEIDTGSDGSGDGDSIAPQNVSCIAPRAPECGERASGAFDARNVFNANVVYELPFGPGKSFFSGPTRVARLLGSWSLSSILTDRDGFPVNITTSGTGPDLNTIDQRPDLVPGQRLYLPGGDFNPAAFCTPGTADPLYPTGTCPSGFGNVPRDFLRGPGVWQYDLALSKRLAASERLRVDFRAEAFNLFNRAQYANPDGLIADSTTFGKISSPLNTTPVGLGTPRQFEFLLKLMF